MRFFAHSLWPTLKCGNGKESQHAVQHIVKVEVVVDPLAVMDLRVMKRILHML